MAIIKEEDDRRSLPELPETIKYEMQPYTYDGVLGNLRWEGEYNGRPILRGTFLEGTERAYLFGHTSVRSIVGESCTVYGVQLWELGVGRIVRVAS